MIAKCSIVGLGRLPETPPFDNAAYSRNSVYGVQFREKAIGNGFWENGCSKETIAVMGEHGLSTNLRFRECGR